LGWELQLMSMLLLLLLVSGVVLAMRVPFR
jgi:hypothetical protein